MSIHDANSKFDEAVIALATSPKSLKQRLLLANCSVLSLIKPEDLPDDLRVRLDELMARLTSNHDLQANEGSVAATLRTMSDSEAEDIARLLISLADAVGQESCRRQYQRR